MGKKYYIYNEAGKPSDAPCSIEDLKQKNLKSDTIVCVEFGEPKMIKDIPELMNTTQWTPPKLTEEKRGLILGKKVKNIALASSLLITAGGGTYYAVEQKSKENLRDAIELDNIQKTEAALQRSIDSLDNVYMGLVAQSKLKKIEYDKSKKETVDLKERQVYLNGQIASVQALKRNNERGRDDADEKAKSLTCFLDCATQARKVRDNFKEAIAQNDQTIVSYSTDINAIENLKLPAAIEKNLTVQKELDDIAEKEKVTETAIEKIKFEKRNMITIPIKKQDNR